MKLVELVEPKIKSVKSSARGRAKPSNPHMRIDASNNAKQLGRGMFASVYERPSRPGTVVKLARVNDKNKDGYYSYINKVAKAAESNPFLPRIYSAKFIEDKRNEGQGYFAVEMEKLHPLSSMDDNMLIAIGNNIWPKFEQHVQLLLKMFRGEVDDDGRLITPHEHIQHALADIINDLIHGINIPDVNNRKLNQALDYINQILAADPKLFGDVHHENVMVRLTPAGPQLVITDPIAQYTSSMR